MPLDKGKAAIVGLGITPMGKIFGRTAEDFAAEAIKLALEDAGLAKAQLDGLLVNAGVTNAVGLGLQNYLGLTNLKLLNHMNAAGSTGGQMVQFAAMAVDSGLADYVACVFADAPLQEGGSAGAAYGGANRRPTGMASLRPAYGFFGANTGYALAAQRHMHMFGTNHDQLGTIAVGQRRWAAMNPHAQMRTPITLEDYHNSRWIVQPLHLLDCCLVSNGAVAVIVTTAERARDLRKPPVYLWGMGQGHPGELDRGDQQDPYLYTGAIKSGERAFRMAGITTDDIDVCEFYDCYTYTVLVTLEDYGFCQKGEGGEFVSDWKLAPGGSLPTNTGGGQLSGYYMWGLTPISEAVIQARGEGGERQVPKHDFVLVSSQGGLLSYHSTLILSPNQPS